MSLVGVLEKLDPFYWFDRFWFRFVGKPSTTGEKVVYHAAEVFYAVIVAYVIYMLLGVLFNTPKPAVIVASQSMVPTLQVGDIVLVRGGDISAPTVEVNVPLYGKPLAETPIHLIHRGVAIAGFEVDGNYVPLERNGDIIVYYNDIYHVDIVHRAVLKIIAPDGVFFLTKGDNDATNPTIDQDCELGKCIYLYPIPEQQVYGKVFFRIPRIGIIKLWLFGR